MPEVAVTAQTLTPQQIDALQRAQKLVDSLWDNPTIGADVRKQAKALFADIKLPDEQVEPVLAPLRAQLDALSGNNKTLQEQIDKMLKEKEDAALADNFEKKLNAARSKYNMTDEGIAKVLARMKETQNYNDVDGAAAAVLWDTPTPKPTSGPSWLPQGMNLFGSSEKDERWEKLHTNPMKYQDDELRAFVADPDAYVRETFGQAA